MRTPPLLPCLLAVLFAAGPLAAGEIDPPFAARMQRGNPGEFYPALVVLEDQVDVEALDRDLVRMRATRGFRHALVVTRLKAKAEETQPALLATLGRLREDGKVRSFESLWLINGVLLTATREVVSLISRSPEVETVYDGAVGFEVVRPFDHGPAHQVNPLDSPEPGLVGIRATDLWNLGFRGKGRIVCNLDTGVDANHPALRNSWRGRQPGVSTQESWFDPSGSSTFPRDASGHGTHTMGTMCGLDGANQIGVAPAAHWIAGMWRWPPTSLFISDAIRGFQWATDPDGDPRTVTDVPDVISNSWGLIPVTHQVNKCDPSFWKAVDNTEYAGVAVIFIAGNEGASGAESLRTPGDRIASPVNTFSVGALEPDQKTIASFSSRGPSGCDHQTIKPEVCAQGASVRSCHLNGSYRIMSGTSMACPHVAGGVALLREVWPHVTAQRVKEILLATADDLGVAGEDNSYGMGRINLLSAYQQLVKERPAVSVSVMGTVRQYKEGQIIRGHVVLMNTTNAGQKVRVSLEFRFDGAPVGLVLVPPVDIGVPPGFTNEAGPLLVSLPIPRGLPASVLDPKKWSLRGEIRPSGGGKIQHASEYEFSLTR